MAKGLRCRACVSLLIPFIEELFARDCLVSSPASKAGVQEGQVRNELQPPS